jgi:hypothetical protein
MRGRVGEELLRLPVRTGGLTLGRSVELLLDLDGRRALGVDVECGDDVRRFLPLAVAELRDEELHVASALVLLEEAERRFYRERGVSLSAARALTVLRGGEALGRLRDVLVGPGGVLEALAVEQEVVLFDHSIAFADRRAPAA